MAKGRSAHSGLMQYPADIVVEDVGALGSLLREVHASAENL